MKEPIHESSGNIFIDLGFAEAEATPKHKNIEALLRPIRIFSTPCYYALNLSFLTSLLIT